MRNFAVSPVALECINEDGHFWVWVVEKLIFEGDPRREAVLIPGDDDTRTWGIASIELDTPDEARWTTEHGTKCIARPVRPYDAVCLGISDEPLPVDVVAAAARHEQIAPIEDRPGSRLRLNVEKEWWDEDAQRERAGDVAAAVRHDLIGEQEIRGWRNHVRAGHLGWAPTKVPIRGSDIRWSNSRFVTPTVAELLWQGERHGFRREHIISRSIIADFWTAAADLDELTQIAWDYRFAVVLTTLDEQQRIDSEGAKVGSADPTGV